MITCVDQGYFILFLTLRYQKFDKFFFKTLEKLVKFTLEKDIPQKIKIKN
jgi:hypothetical protein